MVSNCGVCALSLIMVNEDSFRNLFKSLCLRGNDCSTLNIKNFQLDKQEYQLEEEEKNSFLFHDIYE